MLKRVANSLYWLGRYIERAESNARLLDVNLQVSLDFAGAADAQAQMWESVLATLEDRTLFIETHEQEFTSDRVCEFMTFCEENPNSIRSCIGLARENARTVREFISSEMWERINLLHLWLDSTEAQELFQESSIEFYRKIVDGSHQFHGTTDATLTHGEGWNFLQAGKFLERADCASRILDLKYHILLPHGHEVCGPLDMVQWISILKSCSGWEAYRKEFPGIMTPWRITEFLLLHDLFPRSIRFCVDRLDDALHAISGCDPNHYANEAERLCGRLCSSLNYETIENVFAGGYHEYMDRTQVRLGQIHEALQSAYCDWLES